MTLSAISSVTVQAVIGVRLMMLRQVLNGLFVLRLKIDIESST